LDWSLSKVFLVNHQNGYTAAPAAAVAAAPGRSRSGGGRSVSRLPLLAADVKRCCLRRTQPGNQK